MQTKRLRLRFCGFIRHDQWKNFRWLPGLLPLLLRWEQSLRSKKRGCCLGGSEKPGPSIDSYLLVDVVSGRFSWILDVWPICCVMVSTWGFRISDFTRTRLTLRHCGVYMGIGDFTRTWVTSRDRQVWYGKDSNRMQQPETSSHFGCATRRSNEKTTCWSMWRPSARRRRSPDDYPGHGVLKLWWSMRSTLLANP